ncbi:hypothetical protein B7P02_03220 [Bordetella bronchiseptica]|uniref:acetate--CoA ligase family protein n=1 Tax=Bordetella bronchiseptica TaxID=518 RepID=UPI00045B7A33|nr:acetate--CoA ligase family protein [Bordetella bronchiseptica]AUL13959.1 hypothetical protein BTL45_03215 [Bordetella bronchiseptica]AWP57050.1 hypothetical protein B7P02_03220 [Bordetella bronchiseptica]KAK78623.1 ATP-grasp domain protein [Bordetella bronchiseptica CA90 BB02]KDC27642.1 ATP-grasp domain protein [Bordetella bronchiseptica F4563]RSB97310.1 hypothetical protein EGT31_03520 [Bordetella bronchiseptica]
MSTAISMAGAGTKLDEIDLLLQQWIDAGRQVVHEADSKRILAMAGFPLPGEACGGPAVVKLCADEALHKSELGLVALDVAPGDVERARRELQERSRRAGVAGGEVLVESMVGDVLMEWFVGCRTDHTFGPVVVVGAGGIYAELLGAPEIRMAPLSARDAERALRHHKAFPIIDGARGREPADIGAFARLIADVSEFYYRRSHLIAELDLNPVMVRGRHLDPGMVVADASIILQKPTF